MVYSHLLKTGYLKVSIGVTKQANVSHSGCFPTLSRFSQEYTDIKFSEGSFQGEETKYGLDDLEGLTVPKIPKYHLTKHSGNC